MAQAFSVEAIERGIPNSVSNIVSALAQIADGKYPGFDGSCRAAIWEELCCIAKSRREQQKIDPTFQPPLIEIPGLGLGVLSRDGTLGEFQQIRKYVKIEL